MDELANADLGVAEVVMVGVLVAGLLKIIVFVLGFLTVRLGYKLLRDGVMGKFTFKTELTGVKADLQSGSPGLLFVLLGVMLIGYAMYVDKSFALSDETEQKLGVHQEIIKRLDTSKRDTSWIKPETKKDNES